MQPLVSRYLTCRQYCVSGVIPKVYFPGLGQIVRIQDDGLLESPSLGSGKTKNEDRSGAGGKQKEKEEEMGWLSGLTGAPTPFCFLTFIHSSHLFSKVSRCRGMDLDPPQVRVSVCVAGLALALFGRTKD